MIRGLVRQLTSTEDQPYVINFENGTMADKLHLGIKGAGLCEMTRLELPVPEGFILSTTAWQDYKSSGHILPDSLIDAYTYAIRQLEQKTSKKFACERHDSHVPLLLSVRCGSSIPMPGMMNSVLNLGLNDVICEQLIFADGNERFALDTYRRFLQSYGCTVEDIDPALYEEIIESVKTKEDCVHIHQVSIEGLQEIVAEFKQIFEPPVNPWDQLENTLLKLMSLWESVPCSTYRAEHNISDEIGLAIIIQRMVYGNYNMKSGCGVCFSHHINRGGDMYGEYLRNAEGDEVTRGQRHTDTVQDMRTLCPDSYADLLMCMRILDDHYGKDIQYCEFTVENGKFYLLETNAVKMKPRSDGNRYTVVLHGDDFKNA